MIRPLDLPTLFPKFAHTVSEVQDRFHLRGPVLSYARVPFIYTRVPTALTANVFGSCRWKYVSRFTYVTKTTIYVFNVSVLNTQLSQSLTAKGRWQNARQAGMETGLRCVFLSPIERVRQSEREIEGEIHIERDKEGGRERGEWKGRGARLIFNPAALSRASPGTSFVFFFCITLTPTYE